MTELSSLPRPPSGPAHHDRASNKEQSLVPLELLQNQRRGSITDPSLHAASPPNFRHHQNDQLQHDPLLSKSDSRPPPSFVFGDATPHRPDSEQIRKLLHSPSADSSDNRGREEQQGSYASASRSLPSPATEASRTSNESDRMMVDEIRQGGEQQMGSSRDILRGPQHFDYNMRRHSIAVGQDAHSQSGTIGTKRKMSTDRGAFPPVGEEIDPQLGGPGIPSIMEMEADAPHPKRRNSVNPLAMAQMSLNDRRNSTDARAGPPQWWANERRDSNPPILQNVPPPGMSGYHPGFSGDNQPHGRPPASIASFSWNANHPADHVPPMPMSNDGESNIGGPPRPGDSNNPPSQLAMMPPMTYMPDRRMSVPNTLTNPAPTTTRVLRSRSRPPSRMRGSDGDSPNQSAASPTQDADFSAAQHSPQPSSSGKKDQGSTPYSRSPELRISHKLAERKRRKEMKELFDELRDQLPADRGMKASKWEILSKAIDFVTQLKQSHQDMAREIEMLRQELDAVRQGGMPSFAPGAPTHVVYAQGPPPTSYPPPNQQHPPLQQHGSQPISRPGSSQNVYSAPSQQPGQNGIPRPEGPS
ncbi:BHLH domain-containing protein [Pleurotus pulmonarius]